jgi:dihydroorotase
VSDHNPVSSDEKTLPFAEAVPGATGLELLLGLACKWGADSGVALPRVLATVTNESARVLGNALGTLGGSVGRLVEGGVADVCVFQQVPSWPVEAAKLRSQGKHTPFEGAALSTQVRATIVGGHVAFEAGH